MTFEPTLLSVTGINNHRMMFKNNEIDSLTSFDRVKIRDACAHEEHPLDFFYQTCRELFDSNNNASVQKFFTIKNLMFRLFLSRYGRSDIKSKS
jgi:hypothetical protein